MVTSLWKSWHKRSATFGYEKLQSIISNIEAVVKVVFPNDANPVREFGGREVSYRRLNPTSTKRPIKNIIYNKWVFAPRRVVPSTAWFKLSTEELGEVITAWSLDWIVLRHLQKLRHIFAWPDLIGSVILSANETVHYYWELGAIVKMAVL